MKIIPVTEATLEAVTTEQKKAGLFLVEVQDHADGDFLVFDIAPQKETLTLEQRVAQLEEQMKTLTKS